VGAQALAPAASITGRGCRARERKEGDHIGMLLDLDQGSMTVYKSVQRLGVMATGLSGEYCWAVSLELQTSSSVRTKAAAALASPTAAELAQAIAYEAEQPARDDY
jgi:hypothetical protein